MYLEINELVVFVLLLVGYLFVSKEFVKSSQNLFFFLAYSALFLGSIFTLIEGYYFSDIFNFLEHFVGKALAGIFFLVSIYLSNKKVNELQGKIGDYSKGVKKK